MAFKLAKLFQVARAGSSFDELAELLSVLGVDIELCPCDLPGPEVDLLWRLSESPAAKVFVLHGTAKDGSRLHAVLVVSPLPSPAAVVA